MSSFLTGSLLKKLREDSNYSLQDIATYLGVSKAAVSKWESGYDIKTENLYSLAKLYGVTFSELYEGKLNSEPKDQYWKRNYDLSNYELHEEITNKNIDDVRNLFEHIKLVKEKFIELLPKWASNKLTLDEEEQFELIKQYFEFDIKYYSYKKEGPGFLSFAFNDDTKKEFVRNVVEETKSLSKDARRWELEKIYNFMYDYKENLIHNSRNLKALEYMLSSLSQIEKDGLLYANIHVDQWVEKEVNDGLGTHKIKQHEEYDLDNEEIESRTFIKTILDSGANVLYQYKINLNGWDDEMLAFSDGKKVKVNESIYNKYLFHNFSGQRFVPILKNWKLYSYEQYLEFINHVETDRLKDIVNLRDSNPLEYYKRLLERSYK